MHDKANIYFVSNNLYFLATLITLFDFSTFVFFCIYRQFKVGNGKRNKYKAKKWKNSEMLKVKLL